MQAQGHLGDQAKGALGADEKPGQIIARSGLARPRARADDAAIGQHHLKAQHIVAHGAVAHRRGAAGAGRGHAAQRGIGPRIDRKEQARGAQRLVQRLAGQAGLHDHIHIGGIDLQHPVHQAEIHADTAMRRLGLPLERGARAIAHHGNAMRRAKAQDGGHLGGGFGVDDDLGRHQREMRLGATVLVEFGLGPTGALS